MRIKAIEMDDDGNPATITVTMTAREAALIARMVGETNHAQRNKVQSDGGVVGGEVYDALAGDLFNRFYDSGVAGVPR